jgi:hypothetical protein
VHKMIVLLLYLSQTSTLQELPKNFEQSFCLLPFGSASEHV